MTAQFPVNARVLRPDGGAATVLSVDGEYYEIAYDEGGSGWWPGNVLNWLEVPQWVQFGLAISTSPVANAFLDTLPKGLLMMIGVGLGQASEGKPATFLGGWNKCRAAGMVPPELLAEVVAMASDYGLPAEFVAALAE